MPKIVSVQIRLIAATRVEPNPMILSKGGSEGGAGGARALHILQIKVNHAGMILAC